MAVVEPSVGCEFPRSPASPMQTEFPPTSSTILQTPADKRTKPQETRLSNFFLTQTSGVGGNENGAREIGG